MDATTRRVVATSLSRQTPAASSDFLDHMSRVKALVSEAELHGATIERDVAIDRLLDREGFDGRLFRLPPGIGAAAGNGFMDGLRSLAPEGLSADDFVDLIANGSRGLFDHDAEAIAKEMSVSFGRAIHLRRRANAGLAEPNRPRRLA